MAAPRPVSTAVIAVALALAGTLAGCGGRSSGTATVDVGDGRVPAVRLAAVQKAVCRAAGDAGEDTGRARTIFFADAHDGLHTIARALERVDRTAAADLLIEKQAVEAAFASEDPGAELAAKLGRLAATTRAGLDRLDVSVTPCGA